jgi:hypothetical protein
MRTITFVLAFIFSGYGLATGQELEAYKNIPDGFEAIFPSPPTVTTTTFTTQYDYQLPTHVYTAMKGRERYSITVVDYTGIEKLAQERVKTCPPGAPLCKGTELGGFGLWKHDIRGAAEWAMLGLLKRDTKLTDMTWSQHDLVMGTELQMANPDQSRTYAYIAMHENRLYILEAMMPKGSPPATLFQTSLEFIDKSGNAIRYSTMYINSLHGMRVYPPPTLAGAAAAAGAPGAGRGGRNGGGGGQ